MGLALEEMVLRLGGTPGLCVTAHRNDDVKQQLTNSPQHLAKANLIVPVSRTSCLPDSKGATSSRLTLAGNSASPFYILNLSSSVSGSSRMGIVRAHPSNLMNQIRVSARRTRDGYHRPGRPDILGQAEIPVLGLAPPIRRLTLHFGNRDRAQPERPQAHDEP